MKDYRESFSASLRRRTLLKGIAGLAWPAFAPAQQQRTPELIVREKDPPNLEFPFSTLESYVTPSELFYVRSHFSTPRIASASHKIRVEGSVRKPFTISIEELRKLATTKLTATLECAGNGREFLVPKTHGVQWALGAVSTAEWTGVPLSALLDRAGLDADAVEVVLEGADQGEIKTEPKPPGKIAFARSLPLGKARQPEVLLAFQMNGKDLTPEHGFPVRALVPGYYGMASVKWLSGIRVVREPFQGYWQTIAYAFWDRSMTLPVRKPLREMMVKSSIARPAIRENVPAGKTFHMTGAAWTGNSDVKKVEVSTDGGRSWAEAKLLDPAHRFAWRRWEYDWRVPAQKGSVTLMSRATDAAGHVQPPKPNPNYENYMIHYTLPIEVDVVG